MATPEPEATPPVSIGQVTAGLVVGGLLGIGTGAAGVGLVEQRTCDIDREQRFDAFEGPCFRRSLYGLTIGGSIGIGLGFHVIAWGMGGERSAAKTIGGAVIGAVAGAAISEVLAATNDRKSTGLGTLIALTTPFVGAVVGYHFARTPRSSTTTTAALLQLDRGELALGMPAVVPTGEGVMLSVASGAF